METTVADVLEYLENAGWSELIDSRWERKLTKEIVERFPNITESVLDEVLGVVLVQIIINNAQMVEQVDTREKQCIQQSPSLNGNIHENKAVENG